MTPAVDVIVEGAVEVRLGPPRSPLPSEVEERVEEIWHEERRSRPYLSNGRILCAGIIDGHTLTGQFVDYRLFIARENDADLRRTLSIEPIGVSAAVFVAHDRVVIGRRGDQVTQHPGSWELVPSGGLDEESDADGVIDPLATLLRELEEELDVSPGEIASITPIGLLRDNRDGSYDICYEMLLMDAIDPGRLGGHEYSEYRVVPVEEALAVLEAEPAVPVSRVLLELHRAARSA